MTRIEIQTTLASISLSLFTIYTDILLSLSSFLPYSSSLPHKSYHLSASHTVLFNIAYHTRRFVHPNVRPQNGIMALPTGFLPNLPLLIPSTKLIPLLLHQQVIFSSCLTRHFFFSLLPHDNFLICFFGSVALDIDKTIFTYSSLGGLEVDHTVQIIVFDEGDTHQNHNNAGQEKNCKRKCMIHIFL